jgi:hypothetical protein
MGRRTLGGGRLCVKGHTSDDMAEPGGHEEPGTATPRGRPGTRIARPPAGAPGEPGQRQMSLRDAETTETVSGFAA